MHDPTANSPLPVLGARASLGGALMGLANLVPGISGGTMLVAAGVYPAFISAIADVSRLRLKPRSMVILGLVVAAAAIAIVLLAGPVKDLVVDHRWVMYALFIGLTLGGAPAVAALARAKGAPFWIGCLGGLLAMLALALLQRAGAEGDGASTSFAMLVLAGVAGASAMILPGVSGGYLLLILGQYVAILAAIDAGKQAVRAGDLGALMDPALGVYLPVGIGVVIGIVGVSNLLKILLARFERATLGALLGLLLGAVVGLYPFQQGVSPEPGDTFKGAVVTEATLESLDPADFPLAVFTPDAAQIIGALALIAFGFVLTLGISRIGRRQDNEGDEPMTDNDSKPSRRAELEFDSTNAILADVDRLQRHGYTRAGNWSLGQITWHLATT
ncbi:MAG: DUF368 domain-containing protein, partial [Planctomycetota bacterium]